MDGEPLINKDKVLKQTITNNQSKIFDKHPSEIYRKGFVDKGFKFSEENYINLFVPKSLNLINSDTLKLNTFITYPSSDCKIPKGIVFMFHGMGNHAGISAHIAKSYASQDCIACTYDYRGHGKSEGISGNIENINLIINDTEIFIKKSLIFAQEKYKLNDEEFNILKKNIFITGTSFGGLLAYLISNKNKSMYKGVIFYAPSFNLYTGCLMRLVIKAISYCHPNYKIDISVKESEVCKNPIYFEKTDPIVKATKIRIQSVNELIKQTNKVNSKNYSVPFLIVCPGVDKLCPPTSMFEFYEKSNSKDKSFWYYENMWHSVYIEEEIVEILARVEDWIKERIYK